MANRYWVGGTGTWNTTSTTNWSTASGGASGASVPTAADSVFFDQAGTYTVTMTGALTCLDITVSAGTVSFVNGTTPTLAISGSMTLRAGTVWNSIGTITFNATTIGKTVTTNGTSINSAVTFNGAGGGWTLGSPLTASGAVSVTAGTFSTSASNHDISCTQFVTTGSSTRSVSFNGSTITCSLLSSNAFNASTTTNLTFNAGSSQINLTAAGTGIASGNLTFNNVSFTSTSITSAVITGNNTFNNLTFAGRTSLSLGPVSFGGNQVITGTLTLNAGTTPAYRTFLASNTIGTQRTLTINALSGGADYDFRDIAVLGAAAPIAPTRAGDCGGNSGITFPSAKTVYFAIAGGGNIAQSGVGAWSATSGGSADATQFPLAQDTAIFPAAIPSAGQTITITSNYNLGSIDMSLRTANAMILSITSANPAIHGNWTNGSGITLSGTGGILFSTRTSQSIVSAGKTFTQQITIQAVGGTVILQDNFTSSGSFSLTFGTISLQSFILTFSTFAASGTANRAISFGTGSITVTGSGASLWNSSTATNFSSSGSQVVNFTYAGAVSSTVSPGASNEANSLNFNFTAGTYILTFLATASHTAKNVNFTGFAGTLSATSAVFLYGNLTISTGMTLTSSTSVLTFSGNTGTRNITTNGKTLDFPVTFNCSGATITLQDNFTAGSTRTVTYLDGLLTLNGKTLSTGVFSAATSTGTIAFGTGNITCTNAGGTVCDLSSATLSITGTPVVNINNVTAVATTVLAGTFNESSAVSFNFISGTYTLTFLATSGHVANNVNFTGFSGTWGATGSANIYGNLTLSTGMTVAAAPLDLRFTATSGTKTITSNGKTIDRPLTFNGVGGTWQLQDALTIGSTRTLTLLAGTVDSNGKAVSTSIFSSTGSSIRAIAFGGSTWTVSGASWTVSGSNLTTSGTGIISMTSASAKTFAGGGYSWPVLNNGGAGAIVISGSNTFENLTNTVQPTTFTFTSGTTNIFTSFSISGTAGNLVTLNASSAGSQAILQKNQAWYMGANSTNVSNNTNLVFTAGAGIDYLSVRDIRGNQVGYLISNFFAFFPS